MVEDEGELASLLLGTPVAGRQVSRVPLPDGPADAFLIRCGADEVREVWEAGRSVVEQTSRWPVVTAAWADTIENEISNRFPFHHGDPGPTTTIHGIVRQAQSIDAESVLRERAERDDQQDAWGSLQYFELPYTTSKVGQAPNEGDIRTALGEQPTHAALDRWLMDWEEQHGVTGPYDSEYLSWYEPAGQDTGLLFLPTPNSWEVPAYLSFFGAEGPGGAERLVAVLKRWHDGFGAELVAHFGVMLQFAVRRPPSDLTVAWRLAREHELMAECTTVLPGVPIRHHARVLVDRATWFLFERP